MPLSVAEYLLANRREGELFAAAVAAGDLDARVPTCPEWTLRELAHHLGRVHHWAAANVERGRQEPLTEEEQQEAWGEMPADADLVAWYGGARERLDKALRAAPADLIAFTFLPNAPAPREFWARRQAHELAIHRVDAQAVAGEVDPVPLAFAVDGIDELILSFYSRARSRLRSVAPRTFAIRTNQASWLVHIGLEGSHGSRIDGDPAAADCTVQGSEVDLYYALWNRLPLRDYLVDGDPAIVELWQGNANIRWS